MNEERFRLILQRAEEIEATTGSGQELTRTDEQLIEAAQEAGLSREAVMQALRERFALENVHLQVDSLVYAESSDRYFYPARITSIEGDLVRVTFMNGGEHTVRRNEVKPFTMLPGQMINVPWPNWGWWNSKIISFDREQMKVRVTDSFGTELTVPISETRLKPELPPGEIRERWRTWLTYAAISLGSGALGALIMRAVLR
ncbi:MAG: hypothetical protein K1X67_22010 [Fimbriimonadaceae bacterium]|nr:hypothetical protein [Fimbriimonadaceae bacterium]